MYSSFIGYGDVVALTPLSMTPFVWILNYEMNFAFCMLRDDVKITNFNLLHYKKRQKKTNHYFMFILFYSKFKSGWQSVSHVMHKIKAAIKDMLEYNIMFRLYYMRCAPLHIIDEIYKYTNTNNIFHFENKVVVKQRYR